MEITLKFVRKLAGATGLEMNWKTAFGASLACAAMALAGCLYLDKWFAEFVSEKVGFDFLFSDSISNLPDLLLLLVCVVTLLSWAWRLCLP